MHTLLVLCGDFGGYGYLGILDYLCVHKIIFIKKGVSVGILSTFFDSMKYLGTHKGFARSESILIMQAYEIVKKENENIEPPLLYVEVLKRMRGLDEYDVTNIVETATESKSSDYVSLQDVVLIYVEIAYMRKAGGAPGIQRAQKIAHAIASLEEGVKEVIPKTL
ncbi:MAG: hypothetical protein ACC707_21360 [Thiohalomonadales bacterium]